MSSDTSNPQAEKPETCPERVNRLVAHYFGAEAHARRVQWITGRPKLRWGLSLAAGLMLGVFFHYLLYRFSLPTQPFIYVSF